MKIQINTTGKRIEKANQLLSDAIDDARQNEKYRSMSGLSLNDLDEIEIFRNELLTAYFNKFGQPIPGNKESSNK